jgi:hypothetical protein
MSANFINFRRRNTILLSPSWSDYRLGRLADGKESLQKDSLSGERYGTLTATRLSSGMLHISRRKSIVAVRSFRERDIATPRRCANGRGCQVVVSLAGSNFARKSLSRSLSLSLSLARAQRVEIISLERGLKLHERVARARARGSHDSQNRGLSETRVALSAFSPSRPGARPATPSPSSSASLSLRPPFASSSCSSGPPSRDNRDWFDWNRD